MKFSAHVYELAFPRSRGAADGHAAQPKDRDREGT